MRARSVVAAVLLAGVALAMVVYPPLATYVPANRLFVLLAGAIFLYLGLRTARERYREEFEVAEFDDPETAPDLPTPGDEFDESLAALGRLDAYDRQRRQDLRERLTRAALDAIERERGCTRERAEEILYRGEWTDDPFAAAFFTDRVDAPLVQRVRATFSRESRQRRRARRAALAISELTEGMRS